MYFLRHVSSFPLNYLRIFVLGYCCLRMDAEFAGDIHEVCLTESLEAKCPDRQVIIMTSARYGRMRMGRCVKRNFGFLGGCATDVLNMADRACSGRQSCSIDVFKTFGELRPCSELESYLEVSYRCVHGHHADCATDEIYKIQDAGGSISNTVFDPFQNDGKSCLFQLQGKLGQRWNITLVDFGVATNTELSDTMPPVCQRYAVIREGERQGSVICGGIIRERVVYLSDTNEVNIAVFNIEDETKAHFILRYRAIGCPNPTPPDGAIFRREDQRVVVICNETGNTWQLRCEGDKWVGKMGTCDSETSSHWFVLQEDWTTPYGILLVTALGVALGIVIGGILLTIAVMIYKRKMTSPRPNPLTHGSEDIDIDTTSEDTSKYRAPSVDYAIDSRRLTSEYDYKYQRPYTQGQGRDTGTLRSNREVNDSSTIKDQRVVRNLPPPPYLDSRENYSASRVSKIFQNEHLYEIPQ